LESYFSLRTKSSKVEDWEVFNAKEENEVGGIPQD